MRILIIILLLSLAMAAKAQKKRAREYGIAPGVMMPGKNNAITDVSGVKVGQVTLIEGNSIRTGVTAVIPHDGNIFQNKVPAAIYIGNGFGKFAGYSQVEELGNLETPIILTNTLSVPAASNALISHILAIPGNEEVRSVNPVVGETNDGWLNDIRGRHIKEEHVLSAIKAATGGPVAEGNVGAGTGTIAFGYKGGIGTSSRVLPPSMGGYTVGILVQSNFGGVLQIDGVPVGKELGRYPFKEELLNDADGSCMIVIMTDAPVDSRNLKRLAKRAIMGLAKTGGIASNGSGDYVITASVAKENFIPYLPGSGAYNPEYLHNDAMSPLFMATIEATEEAIINSLFAAEKMTGRDSHTVEALSIEQVLEIMRQHGRRVGKK